MLTFPPHLTKQEKIQAEWKLRFISKRRARTELVSKSNQKDWHEKRTKAETEIQVLLPHMGVFVERHYFENDEEGYHQYSMYAIYHGKSRLSPWYYRVEHLVDWVKPNQHMLTAFLSIKKHLVAQRPPNEGFMRKAP